MINANSLILRYLVRLVPALALLTLTGLKLRAAESAPYAAYFDAEKGFKPAQRNFQQIFLQLAGSLEHHGTPEPYLRHVMSEHARIEAKYQKATGKNVSSRPAYLTDEYLEKLLRNWNKMAPALTLEDLSRNCGRDIRYAIMGGWNMTLEEKVAQEIALTKEEAAFFRTLVAKEYFKKTDLPEVEKFYTNVFDKLTEDGKSYISNRTWLGTQEPEKRTKSIQDGKGGSMLLRLLNEHQDRAAAYIEDRKAISGNVGAFQQELTTQLKLTVPDVELNKVDAFERDAIKYSHLILSEFKQRIDQVRKQAKTAEQAVTIVDYLTGLPKELLVVAQLEFELAMNEDWVNRQLKSP